MAMVSRSGRHPTILSLIVYLGVVDALDFVPACEQAFGNTPTSTFVCAKFESVLFDKLNTTEISEQCAFDLTAQITGIRDDTTAQLAIYSSAPLGIAAEAVLTLLRQTDNADGAEFVSFLGLHGTSLGDRDACHSLPGYTYFVASRQAAFSPAVGLCLPTACSVRDVHRLAAEARVDVKVRDDRYRLKLDAAGYAVIIVCVALAVLVLTATARDAAAKRQDVSQSRDHDRGLFGSVRRASTSTSVPKRRFHSAAESSSSNSALFDYAQLDGGGGDGAYFDQDDDEVKEDHVGEGRLRPLSVADRDANYDGRRRSSSASKKENVGGGSSEETPLLCFSLFGTYEDLLKRRGGEMASLDGMRVLSMCWVIFGHTMVWPLNAPGFGNLDDVVPQSGKGYFATWRGQLLPSAEFAVDTFFWLSGFLATHIILKRIVSSPGGTTSPFKILKKVPQMALQRYVRLTPSYALILFFWWKVEKSFGKGPFWAQQRLTYRPCAEYWWANLLYVNNLVPWNEPAQCYGVAWYLPNDFQLFLAVVPATAMLYSAFRSTVWAPFAFVSTLLLASLAFSWYLAHAFSLSFATFDQSDYFNDYYLRPWTRAPAYLIGVGAALLWRHHLNNNNNDDDDGGGSLFVRLQEKTSFLFAPALLLVAIALCALVVFGSHEFNQNAPSDPSRLQNHTYLVLSKTAWCVGISVVALLSFAGRGGPVAKFLELPAFAPLAKLTFAGYLIHPAVLDLVFRSRTTHLVTFSDLWYATTFLGVTAIVAVFALLVHLCVEAPLLRLEKLMTNRLSASRGRRRGARGGGGPASQTSSTSYSWHHHSQYPAPALLASTPSIEIA